MQGNKIMNLIENQKISPTIETNPANETKKTFKHYPISTREWQNSMYFYNENNMNLMPITDAISMKMIRAYFSSFYKNLEQKLRTRNFPKRLRRKSQNKIFVSDGQFKHTNSKVIINLYLFNRQATSYNIAMNSLKKKFLYTLNHSVKIFSHRLSLIEKISFKSLVEKRHIFLKQKELYLIDSLNKNDYSRDTSYCINMCIKSFFKSLLKKEYDKTLQYFFYKQMVFLNKAKYTYLYLQHLKKQLHSLYNKQVEFNLINLRRFYLNTDIILESIVKKISKKRKKVLRYIKGVSDKVLVLKKKSILHKYKKTSAQKIVLSQSNKQLVRTIIGKLKYKDVTGFWLEAKGRLTKRYTASRSVLRIAHKGSLSNKDSSLKGLSSVLLLGNLKSNLQRSTSASKSRIGAFGLKGWISSY